MIKVILVVHLQCKCTEVCQRLSTPNSLLPCHIHNPMINQITLEHPVTFMNHLTDITSAYRRTPTEFESNDTVTLMYLFLLLVHYCLRVLCPEAHTR
jgi:hypothetical protein